MATTKWSLAKGKTWRQKLEEPHPNHGKRVPTPPRMQKRLGKGTILIPKPIDVDALMRTVKKGKLVTTAQIRDRLAKKARAAATCPLTTGIFMRIAAEAAEEDLRAGKKRVTPYWRTIKVDGRLNDKFPGGAKAQAAKLRKEGFVIERPKGKQPPRVKDYEKHLTKL